MPAGRTPKPTALKKLQGNPGKRRLNQDEPAVTNTLPRCPSHLGDEAKREWRRIAKMLNSIGLLDVIDRSTLAAYCQSYDRWVRAERELEGQPHTVENDKGVSYQNPLLSIARQSMTDMLAAAREFGMTPSARTRIKIKNGEAEPVSLAAELFRIVNN